MRAVLMFHSIDPSGSVLSMSERELDSLIGAIEGSGHRIVPLETLLAGGDRNAVTFTFDDGLACLPQVAAPVFARRGIQPTLFLTTGYVGRNNRWPSQAPLAPTMPMADWDGVRELAGAGWSIQAHTVSHPDLRTTSDADLARELGDPIDEIADQLGTRPTQFAYPYGYLDARVVAAVTHHYAQAVTTTFSALSTTSRNPHRIPRLDSYYFRDPAVHKRFGTRLFDYYLAARGAGRRAKGHPGETGLL